MTKALLTAALLFSTLAAHAESSFDCFAPNEAETNLTLNVPDLIVQKEVEGSPERVKLYSLLPPAEKQIEIVAASTGKVLQDVGTLDPGRTRFGLIKAGACGLALSQLKNNGSDGSYVSRTIAPIVFLRDKKAILFDNLPSDVWGGQSSSCDYPKPHSAAYFKGKFYISHAQGGLIELSSDGSYKALRNPSKENIGNIHVVGGAFYAEVFSSDNDTTSSTLTKYDPSTGQSYPVDYMVRGSSVLKNDFQHLIYQSKPKDSNSYKGPSNYRLINALNQIIDIGSPAQTRYAERDLELDFEALPSGGALFRTSLESGWVNKRNQEEATLLDQNGLVKKTWKLDGKRRSLIHKNGLIHVFETVDTQTIKNHKTTQSSFDELGQLVSTRTFFNSFDLATYENVFKEASPLRAPSQFGLWIWHSRISGNMGYYTVSKSVDIFDTSQPLPNTTLAPESLSKWIILSCVSDPGKNHDRKISELKKRILKKRRDAVVSVLESCEVKDLSAYGFEPERSGIITLRDGSQGRITVQFLRLISAGESYQTKMNYCFDSDQWSGCGRKGFSESYEDIVNP